MTTINVRGFVLEMSDDKRSRFIRLDKIDSIDVVNQDEDGRCMVLCYQNTKHPFATFEGVTKDAASTMVAAWTDSVDRLHPAGMERIRKIS
ncbi:MAG: hypothetical protein ACR2P3_09225 [Geminicoccaceae bacterium]